jgi:large subunit ribosomal protein L31
MKQDLHPEYNPVIFQDMSTGKQFITRSTAKSGKTESVDGVDHFVISIGVTADSHPFFTGQKQFVDTEGRIDKFQKRFGAVRRAKKPVRSEEKPVRSEEKPVRSEEKPES